MIIHPYIHPSIPDQFYITYGIRNFPKAEVMVEDVDVVAVDAVVVVVVAFGYINTRKPNRSNSVLTLAS